MTNEPKMAPSAPASDSAQPIAQPAQSPQEKAAPQSTPANGGLSQRRTSEALRRPEFRPAVAFPSIAAGENKDMNRIGRTNSLTAEDEEREALTPADYIAAGVDVPNWNDNPIPSLETWRRWQTAQNAALAHKRATARKAPQS